MKYLSVIFWLTAMCLGFFQAKANSSNIPSGAPYDWTKTKLPERPYFHQYDQSLVMKIFLAERVNAGRDCKVYLTFEQALDVIKRLDVITCGAPKIIYLVGWQFNGHDSKYPSWSEVNEHLKRQQDPSALASLKWLMTEGKKFHTTVSLHINMIDAYEDSPLWREYLTKDIIAKDKQGQPLKGEMCGDMQTYQISYAKEWDTGCAQKRIDGLLAMLPEIKTAHTIHIDAFHTYPPVPHAYPAGKYPDRDKNFKGISPYLGDTEDQEMAAQRKTFRYFRDHGVDVTCEGMTFLRKDPFIGLQPLSWVGDLHDPRVPPGLACCSVMHGEQEIKADPKNLPSLLEQFCRTAAPTIWANHWRENDDTHQPQAADWARVQQGGDVCIPLTWRKDPMLLAYSRAGYANKSWSLPSEWRMITRTKLIRIASDGSKTETAGNVDIHDGLLTLSLKPGEALAIVP